MTRLFFDIETLPAPDYLLPVWESTLKHPTAGGGEPIRRGLSDINDDRFSKTGLQGAWGQVYCIGCAFDDDQPQIFAPMGQLIPPIEETMLLGFWEMADSANLLVGYNVRRFDIPFLVRRSIVHKVWVPPRFLNIPRYRIDRVFDCMEVWANWEWRDTISMDAMAKALGLPSSKQGMDGAHVWQAYQERRYGDITRYCMEDVSLVRRIYRRMTFQPDPTPSQLILQERKES